MAGGSLNVVNHPPQLIHHLVDGLGQAPQLIAGTNGKRFKTQFPLGHALGHPRDLRERTRQVPREQNRDGEGNRGRHHEGDEQRDDGLGRIRLAAGGHGGKLVRNLRRHPVEVVDHRLTPCGNLLPDLLHRGRVAALHGGNHLLLKQAAVGLVLRHDPLQGRLLPRRKLWAHPLGDLRKVRGERAEFLRLLRRRLKLILDNAEGLGAERRLQFHHLRNRLLLCLHEVHIAPDAAKENPRDDVSDGHQQQNRQKNAQQFFVPKYSLKN